MIYPVLETERTILSEVVDSDDAIFEIFSDELLIKYYATEAFEVSGPYALYKRASLDGTDTGISVEKTIIGLRWRAILYCVLLKAGHQISFETAYEQLGMHMAPGLETGVFQPFRI